MPALTRLRPRLTSTCLALLCAAALLPAGTLRGDAVGPAAPGRRVLADAHNCYPYDGRWSDRIVRALAAGAPLAIEQDLALRVDPRTGRASAVLSHDPLPPPGAPDLQTYFFERVRPLVEAALRQPDRSRWPLITLNLDLKTEQPAALAAVWSTLAQYRNWITTAPRTNSIAPPQPLAVRPLLVLTSSSERQKAWFYDRVLPGADLMVFGAVRAHGLTPPPADNYHRWWNRSWSAIETGGPGVAGAWTPAKQQRLAAMVGAAHRQGLWIRFYTLDGAPPAAMRCHGWAPQYSFGSDAAVTARWRAAAAAGADYIATDEYENLSALLDGRPTAPLGGEVHGSCSVLTPAQAAGSALSRWFGGI